MLLCSNTLHPIKDTILQMIYLLLINLTIGKSKETKSKPLINVNNTDNLYKYNLIIIVLLVYDNDSPQCHEEKTPYDKGLTDYYY